MATGSPNEFRIDLTDAQRSLDAGTAAADAARPEKLAGLQRLRGVVATSAARERDRLVAKYGNDDRRVAAVTERIDANASLQQGLQIEVERASVPTPKTDADTWQLLGHVRNKQRAGVPDLTVSLGDDKGAWIKQAGYACTDKAGFFTLSLKREKAPPKGAAAANQPPAKSVFVRVVDRRKTLLFVDTEPTVPAFGQVMYREIILGDTSPCPPPEEPRGSQPPTPKDRGGT